MVFFAKGSSLFVHALVIFIVYVFALSGAYRLPGTDDSPTNLLQPVPLRELNSCTGITDCNSCVFNGCIWSSGACIAGATSAVFSLEFYDVCMSTYTTPRCTPTSSSFATPYASGTPFAALPVSDESCTGLCVKEHTYCTWTLALNPEEMYTLTVERFDYPDIKETIEI